MRQKLIEPFGKTGRVLPEQIVQKHPHGIHANAFGHGQFFIDGCRVEGVGLEHFQFVDGVGGGVVGAYQKRFFGIPGIGFGRRPAAEGPRFAALA